MRIRHRRRAPSINGSIIARCSRRSRNGRQRSSPTGSKASSPRRFAARWRSRAVRSISSARPMLPLHSYRKPLVIAGLGSRPHAAAIRDFVRLLRVPAMVTYKAKGVVPDRDAWFAGVFTNGALEQEILARADLIVAIGLDRVELLPRRWTPRQPLVDVADDVPSALKDLTASLTQSDWDFDEVQRTMAMQ